MSVLGVSLLAASLLVLLIMYTPSWRQLAQPFLAWRAPPESSGPAPTETSDPSDTSDRKAMPPPPVPAHDSSLPGSDGENNDDDDDDDDATTPKAVATTVAAPVPSFSLSADDDDDKNNDDDDDDDDNMPPPMFPARNSAQRAGGASGASGVSGVSGVSDAKSHVTHPRIAPAESLAAPARAGQGLMAPPAAPALSAAASARRQPGLLPNRGPSSLSPSSLSPSSLGVPARPSVVGGSLAPPPSTTTQPVRPPKTGRNKVMLTPGHSPMDWARLTADPVGNRLRGSGVPPGAPTLLRVTPSHLKTMNGRKGRDAWTALGGMVYNMTPYVPFHPGGAGELLRCAGKDGTKLFNEVHSWVNYDNMLSACRVGILVDEGASTVSPMDEMD